MPAPNRTPTLTLTLATLLCATSASLSLVWAQTAPATTPWKAQPDFAPGALATQPSATPSATTQAAITSAPSTATSPSTRPATTASRGTTLPAGRGTTLPATGRAATPPLPPAPSPAALAAADPFRIKSGLALSAASPFMTDLALPNRPSKYVLLASISQGYELWNLKTGAKEKTSPTRINIRGPVLSPDGQFIAGTHFGPGPAGTDIFSTRTDKLVTNFPSKNPGDAPRVLGFVGADRILLFEPAQPQGRLAVYTIAGGKLAGELPLKAAPADNAAALSASGKYLALVVDRTLSLIDTTTVTTLGSLTLPPPTEPMLHATGSPSLAFSPDGREIAVVESIFPAKMHFTILSVATGETLADKITDAPMSIGGRLEWSPSGRHLLYGMTLLDRASLSLSTTASLNPDVPFIAGVRWVDDDTLLFFSRAQQMATKEVKLAPPAPPAAPGSGIARGPIPPTPPGLTPGPGQVSGPTGEPGLPALPIPDFASVMSLIPRTAKMLTFTPPTAPTPWALPELPPAKPIAASLHVSTVANRGILDSQTVRALLFTDRTTHALIAEQSVDRMAGPRLFTRLERFDLATGKASAPLDLDGTTDALDVSPSGNTLLLRSGDLKDVVRLFTYAAGTYKKGADEFSQFRPFGVAQKNPFNNDPNILRWAALLDDTHMLFLSVGNVLEAVEITPGNLPQVLWRAQTFGEARWVDSAPTPALSADRKLAALCSDKGVLLIDPLTGELKGTLPAEAGANPTYRVALSPDATRLAALSLANFKQMYIDAYDLATGRQLMHTPIHVEGTIAHSSNLYFLSNDFVMTAIGDVYSLQRGSRIWSYDWSEAGFGSATPQDAFFCLAKKDPLQIAHNLLPHPAVLDAMKKSDDELYIWHPGMSVKLDINVQGADDFKQKQIAEWTRQLKTVGITVDDKSPNLLRANSSLLYGQPSTYRINNQPVTLNIPAIGYDIALTVAGTEVWKDSRTTPPRAGEGPIMISVSVKAGETPQQAADRAYPPPTEASQIQMPPAYIEKPGRTGKSTLN